MTSFSNNNLEIKRIRDTAYWKNENNIFFISHSHSFAVEYCPTATVVSFISNNVKIKEINSKENTVIYFTF